MHLMVVLALVKKQSIVNAFLFVKANAAFWYCAEVNIDSRIFIQREIDVFPTLITGVRGFAAMLSSGPHSSSFSLARLTLRATLLPPPKANR